MKLLIAFLLFVSTASFATVVKIKNNGNGGWVGMGGELFKDARNPWFVKNTPEVFYCLKVDKASVSVDEAIIDNAIKASVAFWKSELSRATNQGLDGHFSLGTQTFTRTTCADSKLHLTILFGPGTLDANLQADKNILDYLKDPNKYVGVTVRTSYDLKNLVGRGFMYFSSDLQNPSLVKRAWSRPKILQYALMHEIGHVLGLPHLGTGLMSEVFLDQLVKPEFIDKYETLPYESVIAPNPEFVSCEIVTNATKSFFGIPQDHNCISLKQIDLTSLTVSALKTETSKDELELGVLRMDFPNPNDFLGRPISFLQLPEEQQVFTGKEAQFRSFMIGPIGRDYGTKGKFIPKKPGPSKSVYSKVSPNSLTVIGAQLNGDISPVIQYSSPLGFIYLLPAQF